MTEYPFDRKQFVKNVRKQKLARMSLGQRWQYRWSEFDGFKAFITLIWLAVIAFVVLVAVSLIDQYHGDGTICKGGYKFTGNYYSIVQVIDENGKGIPCQ